MKTEILNAAKQVSVISLNPGDNVLVALEAIEAGESVGTDLPEVRDDIPAGHKIACCNINAGNPILKYGQIIGFANRDISAGEHVHTTNVGLKDVVRDYAVGEGTIPTEYVPEGGRAVFQGFARSDGRVGTRNYIGVLPTVNCSASVARFIADAVDREMLPDFSNVDGIVALAHGSGCAVPPDGEGFQMLQRTLAGYARNPNFGGILLVGLGCETNLVESLCQNMDLPNGPLLRRMVIQTAGGTRAAVQQGMAAIRDMLLSGNETGRQTVPASHITLGLECGGSDAYSAITANPALGAAVDLLIKHGGTAVLSETPEIYGAEHLLTRRAATREVGEKLIARIKWWEDYTAQHGAEINNNPSPGNKAGGLTTILEKSLGAVAKAGSTNLMEVYRYAEPVRSRGLVFMDTPGYDVVSVTGMIAGGANMIGFTTGRGTVCGFKPVPTLKLATNTPMYRHLQNDMDINCGALLEGERTMSEMGALIFQQILDAASGKKTRSEIHGFGDYEFVPWSIGAVL